MRWWILAGLVTVGCGTRAACDNKVEAARRDGVRDADACRFTLTELPEPECAGADFQPRNAWLAVFCGRATLSCIRSIPAAEAACFGGPDTGLLGSS